jgi:RAB protein geranylgeranyltransferase component A
MSKQLAISATFSVFTMAAFTLFATYGDSAQSEGFARSNGVTGAPYVMEAPAFSVDLPEVQDLPHFLD